MNCRWRKSNTGDLRGVEGFLEGEGGEGFGDGAEADEGAVHEENGVEEFGHGFEVVMADKEEAAVGGEVGHDLSQHALGGFVEAGEGFVEQEDMGLLREGAGDVGALALAAAELEETAVLEVLEVEGGDGGIDNLIVERAPGAAFAEVRVAAEFDEAADGEGEGGVDGVGLGEVGNFVAAGAHGLPMPGNGAGMEGDEAGDAFEEGAFAGAVRPEEADAVAAADGKADIAQGRNPSVGDGEIADFQQVPGVGSVGFPQLADASQIEGEG